MFIQHTQSIDIESVYATTSAPIHPAIKQTKICHPLLEKTRLTDYSIWIIVREQHVHAEESKGEKEREQKMSIKYIFVCSVNTHRDIDIESVYATTSAPIHPAINKQRYATHYWKHKTYCLLDLNHCERNTRPSRKNKGEKEREQKMSIKYIFVCSVKHTQSIDIESVYSTTSAPIHPAIKQTKICHPLLEKQDLQTTRFGSL